MSARPWPPALQRAGIQRNSPLVRLIVLGAADTVAWLLAWLVSTGVVSTLASTELMIELVGLTVLAQLAVGASLSLYRNTHRIGSAGELRMVAVCGTVVAGIVGLTILLLGSPVPLALAVLCPVFAVVLMVASRQVLRLSLDLSRRPTSGTRVVVVGAGQLGSQLIHEMLDDPHSGYLPVALLDDDRAKRNLQLHGVRVQGPSSRVREVADQFRAEGVVVAVGRADSSLFRSLTSQVEGSHVWIRVVPSLAEQLSAPVEISQLRDLNVEDLIGRQVTEVDLEGIRSAFQDRRVLVTGAGGSIGSELCRQLHRLDPASLVMLDRDESALHSLSMSIHGRALLDDPAYVLADIRDADALRRIFAEHQPEIVFHAAALKHLPMLERFPEEGWKTNVHGTWNVLQACRDAGVAQMVNISTDKAAAPTSELGRSKLVAEGLTAGMAAATGDTYVSVRFGNVFGSRGSVLVSFAEQIRRGGPLTITHPDVTRYFMTIPEACQLVLQASVAGQGGETLVLDMGRPVRILDIARGMMALAGKNCPIAYTGLRPGEKIDEDLMSPDEKDSVRVHDRIWCVRSVRVDSSRLPAPTSTGRQVTDFYEQVAHSATGQDRTVGLDRAAGQDRAAVRDGQPAEAPASTDVGPLIGSALQARADGPEAVMPGAATGRTVHR
ncbi:polysaccharide biosynthesis protein [Brachybacterium sp. p3-SID1565]|uniref:nucleoside-diphosphate sugar epimerase/dehydratase n=1 Tax=Brachybacterium sp. p3-SID1565 TaxID=2916046 RepID=UPI0021A8A68C|nr:nucleoside-diphosphate sugar epimerase/dehydratase [Brachybacterium sp. p3-SID1565]MCT1385832.1 polysaccharide biosynthesis protein [Brachybacterium sp. p3-SID1565]